MRQRSRIAKPDTELGVATQMAIDEKFLTRANVRYPISGKPRGNGYGEEEA